MRAKTWRIGQQQWHSRLEDGVVAASGRAYTVTWRKTTGIYLFMALFEAEGFGDYVTEDSSTGDHYV